MRARACAYVVVLSLVGIAAGQTCPRPAAECADALHCGGEWDFEAGFYFTSHYLASQCDGPEGGNVSCVPADKLSWVGVGWTHWASFPDWATGGYWGTCSFNENKNCDNVFRSNRSQELTMTCANGVGVIYKSAAVPADHRIRVEAYMKFTPNGAAPDVEHAIGIDPSGDTNPASPNVQWTIWQEQTPSPPQPGGVFNKGTADVISLGPVITVFIRQRAFEPPCQGQTFMVDNVKVFDLGANGPEIRVEPQALEQTTKVGTNAAPQMLAVSNSGSGTLNYEVGEDLEWLDVSPSSGSSSGEADTITVMYTTATLPVRTHTGVITVSAMDAINPPQTVAVTLRIEDKPGDLDGDGDVDQTDFGLFQRCFSGANIRQDHPACAGTDLDHDRDVDHGDAVLFLGCLSGSAVPSDPNCVE